jgi:hypothetical protein
MLSMARIDEILMVIHEVNRNELQSSRLFVFYFSRAMKYIVLLGSVTILLPSDMGAMKILRALYAQRRLCGFSDIRTE